jgi:Flp pilus assembly protein TadD
VLKLLPDDIDAQLGMGNALAVSGRPDEAIVHYTRVLRLKPGNAEANRKIGTTLALEGKADEAIPHLQAALRSDPSDASAHFQLGSLLGQRGQTQEAISHYEESLKLRPDAPEVLNNLAWIQATSVDPALRNGPEAVREALKACELTHDQQPLFLGTLAAAYAEAGDFTNAISVATRARDLAKAHGLDEVAGKNEELLGLYKTGQAYHEVAPPANVPAR